MGSPAPAIGRLQRESRLITGEDLVTVEQVSSQRASGSRSSRIPLLCDAELVLTDRADMVACESTFADTEAGLAREFGHLTAGQAGRVAAESRARLLVPAHFSDRIAVPSRHPSAT